MEDTPIYLNPTYFIDSDSPSIMEHASSLVSSSGGNSEKAVKLFYAVRDGIRYNPYRTSVVRNVYRASFILGQGDGYCVQKAILLAALSRAAGVPCRLRFATVRNHLVTRRLREVMKTDLFVFHGYNEFFIDEKWVKATPAFNRSLCEKFGVLPLEFDGRSDSIFHTYDTAGRLHMEYIHDYGHFDDFPFDLMVEEFKKYYAHLIPFIGEERPGEPGDFEREAGEEDRG